MKRTAHTQQVPPLPVLDEVVRYNTTSDAKRKIELAARIRQKRVAELLRELVEPVIDGIVTDWERQSGTRATG